VPHYALNVIIGPNGAGKTTLCDVISGKTRASQGRVQFAGQEITRISEVGIARRGVGRKFQTPTVFDGLDVRQNMELALPGRQDLVRNLNRKSTDTESRQIDEILDRVRLIDDVERPVKFLSHGQRQWLEISMLILSKPQLLLVDEPAAGLTDEETVLTAELLLELQDEHSIIVIEHDMEFVRLLNSRVTVLNEGRIIAQGSLDQVKQDPEVIEAYLGR
jgi:urea transport system ATP-binding protein